MERCKSKKNQIGKLSEVEKLKLKSSRPTPDIATTQDCSSSGMNFFLTLFIFQIFLIF